MQEDDQCQDRRQKLLNIIGIATIAVQLTINSQKYFSHKDLRPAQRVFGFDSKLLFSSCSGRVPSVTKQNVTKRPHVSSHGPLNPVYLASCLQAQSISLHILLSPSTGTRLSSET